MKGKRHSALTLWRPAVLASVVSIAVVMPARGAAPLDEPTVPSLAMTSQSSGPPWRVTPFAIRSISPAVRFEVRQRGLTTAWPPTVIHDSYGVPMRIYDGVKRYHPVQLARLGLAYLRYYRLRHDPVYLDRAKRIAGGLQRIAVTARGGLWFPYRFRWTMHGVARWVNRPPWYSGMAQGLALALFTRLWQYTADASYRSLADGTYNTMRTLGRGTTPWVSWIDGRRYVWIEEYPQVLDQTLNGFIFAIIGLYDYSQITKDPSLYRAARHQDVLALLRGGITTIRAYTPTFRNPGTVSDYCLAHHYRNPKYHPVHITLLRYLTTITGDPWFGRMADAFVADVT
ncbi:MAG TPA: D-glucuronyl C5-epimerase family protein [Candidatus Limnocylindrales bacterium]|nr:D-glucuronyl C5-epimerase family protein [Candidatus Limnocylindrales bacterium]